MQTINFGIDLGTTNSLIAKYSDGKVEVFKNPIGHKETLPSVVAFKKERMLMGDKAKEYTEKDPENVFSSFKRKMGTAETFFVPAIQQNITPIDLSAHVLKELKNFIYTDEKPQSVVITIPASFDTIQSNATKEAGYKAGFSEVLLLQEPIAASLAFANKRNDDEIKGKWIVYDLGGGTFDVALLTFENGEMRVKDHEGDNFLGGVDFDKLIVEQLIVPHLLSIGTFHNLHNELKQSKGKYNKEYYVMLLKAEEAKVFLSKNDSADIEFEIEDDNGKQHDVYFSIKRSEFEAIIDAQIDYTLHLLTKIIEKNELQPSDIEEVILIGGSTYIPLVRNKIEETLGIKVNTSTDPTTAVAMGAAYYAGSKTIQVAAKSKEETSVKNQIEVKAAFQKQTQDSEEYFVANVTGNFDNAFYRITRLDGGFDTGIKVLTERISEVLHLLPHTNNHFQFKVFDKNDQTFSCNLTSFEIVHGKFSVFGQPLPNDICIEIDDIENGITKCEVIFEKNAILPLKKTILKEITRTIKKGSKDQIIINVLEGNKYAIPSSNFPLGVIEIKGEDMESDLIKGSDVEIKLEMTESRDLKIKATLLVNDQEFDEVFSPSLRVVSITKLIDEVRDLNRKALREMADYEYSEQFELAASCTMIQSDLEEILEKLENLSENDVTDERYQLEEKKRKLSQSLDNLGKNQKLIAIKEDYFETKEYANFWLAKSPDESLKLKYNQIIAKEKSYLSAESVYAIKNKIDEINHFLWIHFRSKDAETIIGTYHYYATKSVEEYIDPQQHKTFQQMGDKALERQNYQELLSITNLMYANWKYKRLDKNEDLKGTGIG